MNRGDIYFVTLDPAAGHEQQGMRPVMIVSPNEFNRLNGMPLIVPITSGGAFARNAGFAVSLAGSGTKTNGVILCNQLRVLDISARNGRRVEAVPHPVLSEVLDRLATLFQMN